MHTKFRLLIVLLGGYVLLVDADAGSYGQETVETPTLSKESSAIEQAAFELPVQTPANESSDSTTSFAEQPELLLNDIPERIPVVTHESSVNSNQMTTAVSPP